VLVEELNFNINEAGNDTALRETASSGHPEILQYLLDRPECLREGRLEPALYAARYFLPIGFSLSNYFSKFERQYGMCPHPS